MLTCDKCGNTTKFYVTAIERVTWLVDGDDDWLENVGDAHDCDTVEGTHECANPECQSDKIYDR